MSIRWALVLASTLLAAAAASGSPLFEVAPEGNKAILQVRTGVPAIGDLRVRVPESIANDPGSSAWYPEGSPWTVTGDGRLNHVVSREGIHGPGNIVKLNSDTAKCAGVEIPIESPVEWSTQVTLGPGRLDFTIRLTNVGTIAIRSAGATVCVRLMQGKDWWKDESTFVLGDGKLLSLAELGREAGEARGRFEAYLMRGLTYNNKFLHEFWGVNPQRVDVPVLVSHNAAANVCLEVASGSAYGVRSNRGNPCTDLTLAFGDLAPGETKESNGCIVVHQGAPDQVFASYTQDH